MNKVIEDYAAANRDIDRIIGNHMSRAIEEIKEKYDVVPSSIDVSMFEHTTMSDSVKQYVLGSCHAVLPEVNV